MTAPDPALQPPNADEGPEVFLKSAGPVDGGFEFQFQSSVVPIIAEHLAEMFKAMGGENYVGFEIDHVDLGPLSLTMQRRWGEAPERQAARYRELSAKEGARAERAEAEAARLREALTSALHPNGSDDAQKLSWISYITSAALAPSTKQPPHDPSGKAG